MRLERPSFPCAAWVLCAQFTLLSACSQDGSEAVGAADRAEHVDAARQEPQVKLRPIELPRVPGCVPDADRRDASIPVVTLQRDGHLFVDGAHGLDRPIDLRTLAKHVARLVAERPMKDRVVLLRIDAGAPWRWTADVMIICSEQRIPNFRFDVLPLDGAEGSFRLDVTLGGYRDHPARDTLRVHPVRVRAGGGKPYFVWRTERLKSIEDVVPLMRRSFANQVGEGVPPELLYGKIRADDAVPTGLCFRLVGHYTAVGYVSVQFYATRIPSPKVRATIPLPQPD